MKSNELEKYFRKKQVSIQNILLRYYKELNLNEKELIFISYLFSDLEIVPFNIIKYADDLFFTTNEIMEILSNLCEKKLINMVVKKDEHNIMKEYLDLSFIYNKLLNNLIIEDNDKKEELTEVSDIYTTIEKEFGRTLSPIEYETIKQWLDAKISEDLIKEALKEAVLNGVNNLKYIDKILFEWTKKGYKKAQDIKPKKKEEQIEIFEYDWLKENE